MFASARMISLNILRRHLGNGGDLAVLDAPQAERPGDVAVLVERDRADHAFILDRLSFLDELDRLANSSLPALTTLAAGSSADA